MSPNNFSSYLRSPLSGDADANTAWYDDVFQGKIESATSAAGSVLSTTHTQRNEGNVTDATCGMKRFYRSGSSADPAHLNRFCNGGRGPPPPSPQPEPSRWIRPTKLMLSRMILPKLRRMSPPNFRRPSPPKLRKLTFAVPSAFLRTKPLTPLFLCVPVKGVYDDLRKMDGKDAASLNPLALVLSHTNSTGMTNPVSKKLPQRRNMKTEAKERQQQQEPLKEHNNRSMANATLKARRRKNRQGGMKGCLTAAMVPRGVRGHDYAFLIDDKDDGNSASERGRNDTDMVGSKKDLYFIIVRDEARGAASLSMKAALGAHKRT